MDKLIFADVDITQMESDARALIEINLGRKIADADPIFLLMKSFLAIIAQQRACLNEAANQNLLYYATGKNLEALGELVGVQRMAAARAVTTMELTLSAVRAKETVIPAGVRFSAGDNVYFALDEGVIFLAGETSKTAKATCLIEGENGNGYAAGEINKIVDPQPFLKSAVNITASDGGADIEPDDALRERIRIAPESFSVAGPRGAYIFHSKEASELVGDIYCDSPTPGVIDIFVLLKNGEIPGAEILEIVYQHLNADEIRPLTDFVRVFPAEAVNYNIEARYFISRNDATQALQINAAANSALNDFISWQKTKLGRDLNPTELYFKLRSAGVKRVEIIEPAFQKVPPNAVAIANDINLVYGGLEDD